ncbi:MAG: hypothetical protein BIFFINMI_03884 [Phycisphaerae bacterium]|nr:hypothetical protein [Phycisphaerae bacterium]
MYYKYLADTGQLDEVRRTSLFQAVANAQKKILTDSRQPVTDFLNQIQEEVKTARADLERPNTEYDKRLTALSQLEGVKDKDILKAVELFDELKKIDDEKKRIADIDLLNQQGASLTKSLESPIEQYQEKIQELQKLLDAHSISQRTYLRGIARAEDELAGSLKATGKQFEHTVSRRIDFRIPDAYRKDQQADPIETLVGVSRQQLTEISKIPKRLDSLVKKLADKTPL